MKELQIFNSKEFGDIRTVTIDNEPWFVGKDVATALGYAKPLNALSTHVEKDDSLKQGITDSLGREQETIFINESGLYALIFGSKLDSAKRFKRWVTSEVLPAIRKTGSYQKSLTPQEMLRIQLSMIDNHEDRIADLEQNMTIDYGQQMALGDTVSKVVIDALGGKESNAYKEIGKKVFAECNRDLKHYFNVNARNNVPKKKFDEAMQYVKSWQPCTNTRIMIQECNAQLSMECD
ncbi:hypothetical protein GPK73_03755 [Coprococcus comes]|uniref:BRO family protein n=1 Tax=Coprococcus comes TaxID=410072 RepID=UPI001C02AC2E|nr:BRO family protein [Coprococcus comes]MBT9763584.1 hypothetical protein [Coprococcus comes]